MKELIARTNVIKCCVKLADELVFGHVAYYKDTIPFASAPRRGVWLIANDGFVEATHCPFCGTKIDIIQAASIGVSSSLEIYQFKLNDEVSHPDYGEGVVYRINPVDSKTYPVMVEFPEERMNFTLDGRLVAGDPVTLELIKPLHYQFQLNDMVTCTDTGSLGRVIHNDLPGPHPLTVAFYKRRVNYTADGRHSSTSKVVLALTPLKDRSNTVSPL